MNIETRRDLPYHIIAIAVVAIWGVTFINTKVLLQHGLTPHEIFTLRFTIAYLGIWTFSPRKLLCNSWRDELWMVLLGITGGSLYFLSENTAIGLSLATNVSFIVSTSPLIAMLIALALFKSFKATPALIAGSLISLFGVALVIFNGSFILKINPKGDFLALTAALCWATYSLCMRKMTSRYNATFITRKVFFYGLLTILPFYLVEPWTFPLRRLAEPAVWGNLLFLSCVASLACYVLWNKAIKRLGALRVTNYVYLNPVTTMIGSAIYLHEPMTWMSVLGSAMILVGIFLARKTTY